MITKDDLKKSLSIFGAIAAFFGVALGAFSIGKSGIDERVSTLKDQYKHQFEQKLASEKSRFESETQRMDDALANLRSSNSNHIKNLKAEHQQTLTSQRAAHAERLAELRANHIQAIKQAEQQAAEFVEARAARSQQSQEQQLEQFARVVQVLNRVDNAGQLPNVYQPILFEAARQVPKQLLKEAEATLPKGVNLEPKTRCISNGEIATLSLGAKFITCKGSHIVVFVTAYNRSAVISVDGITHNIPFGKRREYTESKCRVFLPSKEHKNETVVASTIVNCS